MICAGNYPAEEAERTAEQSLPVVVIPPGVDIERFSPANAFEKEEARKGFEIPNDSTVILALTRLVPRKGIDVLIEAVKILKETYPELLLLIGGTGRDARRLEGLSKDLASNVKFHG